MNNNMFVAVCVVANFSMILLFLITLSELRSRIDELQNRVDYLEAVVYESFNETEEYDE